MVLRIYEFMHASRIDNFNYGKTGGGGGGERKDE